MNSVKFDSNKFLVILWLFAFWRGICITVISSLIGIDASLLNMAWLVMIVGLTVVARIRAGMVLKKGLLSLLVMLLFYLVSLLLSYNDMSVAYFQNFILYVILGAFLVTQMKNLEYVLTMYCYTCIIAFFAFAFLPFTGSLQSYNNMAYFGTGMKYGESVIAPCFFGIYVLYKQTNKQIYFVLSVLCLALGVFLANRSTFLVCICFVLLYGVWIEKIDRKKLIYIFILSVLVMVIINNFQSILTWLINLLAQYDINSYALNKYLAALVSSDGYARFSSGRDDIYNIGVQYFLGNPILGIGIGTLYVKTGIPYVHNILLDWFSTLGVIGGGIMFGMTAKALWNMFHVNNRITKIFLCILLGLWFPKLIFSKTFVDDVYYWMFMVCALSLIKIRGTKQYDWLSREER